MARSFGKIDSGFWQHRKVRPLSDDGKLLALYLYSCPHGNSLGCFVLPVGYVTADLGWEAIRVSEQISILVSKQLIEYDSENNLVYLNGFVERNPIVNIKMAKGAMTAFNSLPNCGLKRRLQVELDALGNKFWDQLGNKSQTDIDTSIHTSIDTQRSSSRQKQEVNNTAASDVDRARATSNGEEINLKSFDAAAACAAACHRKILTPSDSTVLLAWQHAGLDIESQVLPVLVERSNRYLEKNRTTPANPLAYFDKAVREAAGIG